MQCVEVYRKLNPTYGKSEIDPRCCTQRSEIFILGENENFIPDEDEQCLLTTDKSDTNDRAYETNYLEFNEEDERSELLNSPPQPSVIPVKNVLNRNSYTVEKKLKIILYAEENGNRMAARFFDMNESTVRCFRRHKEVLLNMSPLKRTNRKAFPHWPKLEAELKDFVNNYPAKHGLKAKLKEIKKEAISIAEKHGIENFNGSNSYIFKFMQRHSLPSANPRPRKIQTNKNIKKEIVLSS